MKFWGIQNDFVEHLQAFNWFAAVKMYLANIYKPSTGSAVVQTCMTILHRHSTVFMVVKMCITIRYMHSTGIGVVKTGLLNLYSP